MKVRAGGHGRNLDLKDRNRNHGNTLFTGLPHWLAQFVLPYNPGPAAYRWHQTSIIHQEILPQTISQSDRDNSIIKVPSS